MINIQVNRPITNEDLVYYSSLNAVMEHVAPNSTLVVWGTYNGLIVHVELSNLELRQELIQSLMNLHKLIGIKIEYSKSLAVSKLVSFNVGLFKEKHLVNIRKL